MTVYLLHFERPIAEGHPCQHYLGYTKLTDLDIRIDEHRRGVGSRLTQVAFERGIAFVVARVWRGKRYGRTFERYLKNRREGTRLCPVCSKKPKPCRRRK